MIDCKVNDWMKNLFSDKTAIQKKEYGDEKEKSYSIEDKLKIISQLRLLNTPVSDELATKMENEL